MNKNAKEKIRVGIVGAGNWAAYGHLPALKLFPVYEVVSVYSREQQAARTTAERLGIKHIASSIEELARDPEVDLVTVLTTAPQHELGVRAALAAGKDVYSEWPFTISTAKAEELTEMARRAGVRHTIGLQRRLSPTNRYIGDLIRDGYVGALRSVRLHVSMNYFQARLPKALQWTIAAGDFSDVVAIYAGHFLDALFAHVGWPVDISCEIVNQFKEVIIIETGERINKSTPDELVLYGRFGGGAVLSVHIEGGKRNNSGVQLDITGDQGDLKVTNVSAFGGVGEDYIIQGAHGDNIPLEVLPVPAAYQWVTAPGMASAPFELAHLYAAYADPQLRKQYPTPSFEDGLRLHRFFDQMYGSAQTGSRVSTGPNF